MADADSQSFLRRNLFDEKLDSENQTPIQKSEPTKSTHHAYIIAIANQKGGVAKTSSTAALGGALVLLGYEVLVVDLDTQANLTLALGKDPAKVRNSITEVFFNSATIMNISRETAITGLDLVPSNPGMEMAERFLPVRKNFEYILIKALTGTKDLLPRIDSDFSSIPNYQGSHIEDSSRRSLFSSETAQQAYDFIILDCPPFIGAVTVNAMAAADMLIIPAQPEFFSAHALRAMMTTVRQVRENFNPNLVYRILITMYDQRNRIHRDVLEQIRTTFGTGVLKTIIQIDTKLRESAVAGLPVTHHSGKSRSARQYTDLANELVDYIQTRTNDSSSLRFR